MNRNICANTVNTYQTSMNNLKIWRLVRQPFVLCPNAARYHKCQWEMFAFDEAGCILCGAVHKCDGNSCEEIVETESSYVCLITGCVLKNRRLFSEDEFVDTTIACGESKHMSTCDQNEKRSSNDKQIDRYTEELLCSDIALKVFLFEKDRSLKKIKGQIENEVLHVFANNDNAIDAMCSILKTFQIQQATKLYDGTFREKLCSTVSESVKRTLYLCQRHLDLSIKSNDLKYTVWGLIYMMRNGVMVMNVPLIPKLPDLSQVLCSEAHISRCLGFKAKHITDVENKFKYAFRNISKKHLLAMGALTVISTKRNDIFKETAS